MGFDDINIEAKKKKKTVSITLNPDVDKEFTVFAKKVNVSKSVIIEELIKAYLESKKNLFED